MTKSAHKAVAIVGMGAVMPDAPDLQRFWKNIREGKYSISDVPEDRWKADLYYDPDPKAPDKSYTKIGGWVREDHWDPLKWRLPIPPKVSAQMDDTQKWAVTAAREALMDFGYPGKDFNKDRTAVILGVAMGGDQHLYSSTRIFYPEYAALLSKSPAFQKLPVHHKNQILEEWYQNMDAFYPGITEDTMPGELSNIVAGRIAALYNFHGPNYIVDAACASAMAGMTAAIEGLEEYDYDLVVTGGIDANMSPTTFVKFCKIGALSATGTRPYAEGADGFVMGEGAAIFILKRLEDAERDGDRIYAVIRSIAGSSDGKGKGITAPNPAGQIFAVKRAWENAGVSPKTVSMIEGHGTSTSVGDAVELQCLQDLFGDLGIATGSIALGSVKSNIGHLKGAAGAAGVVKAALSLHEKVLPPSLNFHRPNPGFDFTNSPFAVNTQLRPWERKNGDPRRCGVSAFGFGGTNFHVVMEEYIPGRIASEQKARPHAVSMPISQSPSLEPKSPLRGALVKGMDSIEGLINDLEEVNQKIDAGWTPQTAPPGQKYLQAPYRIAIDFENSQDLKQKIPRAIKGLKVQSPGMWKPLNAKGIFFGAGKPQKIAFLFTGQGSQYVNMLKILRDTEPVVAATFEEADRVMTPLLGKPLTRYIFTQHGDQESIEQATQDLKQTEITQPAMLTVDIALYRLMRVYGIKPDFVIGHSLGEYGALVAAGAMTFPDALKAVSARGTQMARVNVEDKGILAAIFGPAEKIQSVLETIDGYVVIANMNSNGQSVIGGETKPVQAAMQACRDAGMRAAQLPVSHAFHTKIVAPASEPLAEVLGDFDLKPPAIPVVANIHGDFYPSGTDGKKEMIEILSRQVASPVQFVKGINRLYESGARVFVEIGPKKALHGFARDILSEKEDVTILATNHPKAGDIRSFNEALCGLFAAGHGIGTGEIPDNENEAYPGVHSGAPQGLEVQMQNQQATGQKTAQPGEDQRYMQLGRMFVDFMDKANAIYTGGSKERPQSRVYITGAAVGLPKVDGVFKDSNVAKLLNGEQMISSIPVEYQKKMLEKNITRLVKTGKSGPRFETLSQLEDVIKLAARKVNLDIVRDFGFPQSRIGALDTMTQLAIGAGVDALRDAGIPLVMHYKSTTTGSSLPDRWLLPDQMKDDTGIIFASAFPGYNALTKEMTDFYEHKNLEDQVALLKHVRTTVFAQNGNETLSRELDNRIDALRQQLDEKPYAFNRRFLLRILSMGHSQFAEYIGARGPNTQINSACASTTMAVGLARDWIHSGRCKRVIIIAGDDITSDETIPWFSSGFLAVGAAATDEKVEDAALPFDKRRHGMLVGMGGAAIVVEDETSASQRGIAPICEVLGSVIANSAFHATRLDVDHIRDVMEKMISDVEQTWGIDRHQIAAETVFISHETYTPARGGSASAEISALRHVFGPSADKIVIANTKGMTGHAMAVGIEDVLAIKSLETGIVPPVPNFKVVDPELGQLNLSKGGTYPVRYALRLGAGFGSQISMSLLRWTPVSNQSRPSPDQLGYHYRIENPSRWQQWLKEISGKQDALIEVSKRTLRVKDPLAAKLNDVPEESLPGTPVTSVPEEQKPASPAIAVTTNPGPVATKEHQVRHKILALVAEQTGYPEDMLDPDLDLEADLGIDTVKQAELFAGIRNVYGIERDDQLQLSDFPSINHIIQFVFDKRPDLIEIASPDASAADQTGIVTPEVTPAQEEHVKTKILELIAEQTGYPKDMLDPDLDLEADLGIDTVKQAELFAEIRTHYDIPRDDNLQLSDFPTMHHIIAFVFDKRPDLQQIEATENNRKPTVQPHASLADPDTSASPEEDGVQEKILALIAEKTGYPKDMLDPDLDLEADLGIDTVKQAELFAEIRGQYNIERDDNLQLSAFPTLNHIVRFVYDKRPDLKNARDLAPAAQEHMTPAPPPAMASSADRIVDTIISMIAAKTGYPEDMLDPDLDLEADLGIDTVKQAELFAEIRGQYNIERDDNLQLSEFPTIQHIARFVRERGQNLSVAERAKPAESTDENRGSADAQSMDIADTGDPVMAKVLSLVAEKTGYPEDMLDPDLDLEADLGIDTVKQAELFADIRMEYDIPRDDNLQLADFPTLTHIVQFVYDRRPSDPHGANGQSGSIRQQNEQQKYAGFPAGDPDALKTIPRRVPVPRLRPDLKFCKRTGASLDRHTAVVIMPDQGRVGEALAKELRKRRVSVHVLDPDISVDTLTDQLDDLVQNQPIQGVFWLPALDVEGAMAKLDYKDWKAAVNLRVKSLFATMRTLVSAQDEPAFLVSATRMGGHFGYDANGAIAPLGGAVSGFTKAYKREHPEALVKVVDFKPSRKTKGLADLLIAETRYDPGIVEVGYQAGQRWTIGFEERPQPQGDRGMQLSKETTFLVTGAAGSITSAITADLAAASGGIFYLLDLTPAPEEGDQDLDMFSTDPDELKRTLFARIKASGGKATPVAVNKQLAEIERRHAAREAIRAVEQAGGKAIYFSVNLLDHDAVAGIIRQIRDQTDHLDVLLHAGGVEISHLLQDKTMEEFDLVFDVKADGWYNLLHALGDFPIGASVVFSSIAGRFGNAGQTDYSAANDFLCKCTAQFRSVRKETRGIAIDWTAWKEIGMAARGSIPTVMAQAGIDMLPPEAGIPFIRKELTAGTEGGEVIVGRGLGIMIEEFDPTGGLDITDDGKLRKHLQDKLMVQATEKMGLYSGLVTTVTFDPKEQGFLFDHQINGMPVLPGVMGVEAMVEAATAIFPDLYVQSIEDVAFLAPFKFYREEPRAISVRVDYLPDGKNILAKCTLLGYRTLFGKDEAEEKTHFRATVRLTDMKPAEAEMQPELTGLEAGDQVLSAEEIYRLYFHGPTYQVIENAWMADGKIVGRFASALPPNHQPGDLKTIASPRLIELCFQTAGIWEMGKFDYMGLPRQIDRLRIYRPMDNSATYFAIVTHQDGAYNASVVDTHGVIYLELTGYATTVLSSGVDPEQIAPIKAVINA